MIHLLWLSLSIPVIIHLVFRRKAKPLPFSTLYFLRMLDQRVQRSYRLKEILLLCLRLLLLGALVGALERPIIRSKHFKGAGVPTTVCILLDNSCSMQATTHGSSGYSRATAACVEILDGLSGQDNVILAPFQTTDPNPPSATSDLPKLRKQIAESQCGWGTATLSPSLGSALAVLAESQNQRKEIYILTDMQKLLWTPALAQIKLPEQTPVFLVDAGADTTQNLAIIKADFGLKIAVRKAVSNLYCQMKNTGVRSMIRNLAFVVREEKTAEQEIKLPAGGDQTVVFSHIFEDVGSYDGYVELEPDGLLADNRRYFTVQVHDKVPVLLVNGAPSVIPYRDGVFYLNLALKAATIAGESLSPIEPKTIMEADVLGEQLTDYACVVLANVPRIEPRFARRLDQYVRGGGGLIIFCGDQMDPADYNTQLGGMPTAPVTVVRGEGEKEKKDDEKKEDDEKEKKEEEKKKKKDEEDEPPPESATPDLLPAHLGGLLMAKGSTSAVASGEADSFFSIRSFDAEHPIFREIKDSIDTKKTQIRRLYAVMPVAEDEEKKSVVLMSTDEGPLMLEKKVGSGTVVLFTSTCTPEWNNMPLRSYFLPLVHQITYYLGRSGIEQPSTPVGMAYSFRITDVDRPVKVRFYAPLKEDEEPEAAETPTEVVESKIQRGENRVTFMQTDRPGVYRAQIPLGEDSSRRQSFAVNVPGNESELERLPTEEVKNYLKTETLTIVQEAEQLGKVVSREREGLPLWDYLLMITIIVAVAESYVANVKLKQT